MIPRSKSDKKTSYTAVPESLGEQLAQTFSKNDNVTAEELTVQQEIKSEQPDNTQKISTSKKQNREGQINICIPPEIKTEWKQNQWNRTHLIKISNTSTIKIHHCARPPLDK